MENKRINALDLFAGAGGLSLGMQQAGLNIVAAIEYDKKIAKTYEYNHPNTVMINKDIKEVPALMNESFDKESISIEEVFKRNNKDIDVVFGGPPCQGFSMAGYRIRNQKPFLEDERNLLYLEFIRMVEKLKPKVVVIENVPGILNFNSGSTYIEIKDRFNYLGYDIHAEILSSEYFGVPQKRRRAIFIGNRLGIDSREFFPKGDLSNQRFITVWDAISDLPSLKSGEGTELTEYASAPKNNYQKLMREDISEYGFYNHISSVHKLDTIKLLKMIKPGQTMKDLPENLRTKSVHSGAYGRMDPNEPAYTITTRLNTPSVGRITHPVDHRTISPREAARIQSFPDSYRFMGDITSIGMQIGNSVPPLLSKAIGQSVVAIIEAAKEKVDNRYKYDSFKNINELSHT